MVRINTFVLILGVTSILYGIICHLLNRGKYEVEGIEVELPMIMFGLNLNK